MVSELNLADQISHLLQLNEQNDVDAWSIPEYRYISQALETLIKEKSLADVINVLADVRYEDEGAFTDVIWTSYFNVGVKYPWTNTNSDVVATPILRKDTPMARKEQSLLNELSAQFFSFCMEAMIEGAEYDAVALPGYMDKAQRLAKTLLPADAVYVAHRLNQKVEACGNIYDDEYVAHWFASCVLEHENPKEFRAQYLFSTQKVA